MASNFLSNDMGIDLGTANTLVYVKGEGLVSVEPSVIAVRRDRERGEEILAIGKEAKLMLGRTPDSISAIHPLKDGVIADFQRTHIMLQEYIQRFRKHSLLPPRVVVCVPSGVTTVEWRAVKDAAKRAGARGHVKVVKEPMAAAIGSGLPIHEASGNMIVDIGGGTTEIAVISLGGIVSSMSLRTGGNKMDEAIAQYLKHEYKLMAGNCTCEDIKIKIGSACLSGNEQRMDVRGRDLITGLPKTINITSSEVTEALHEVLFSIIDAIKLTLERTPPELASDVMDKGIMLSGGGSLLKDFDKLLRIETGIPAIVAENAMQCVVLGAGKIVENPRDYVFNDDLYEEI